MKNVNALFYAPAAGVCLLARDGGFIGISFAADDSPAGAVCRDEAPG